ncbi:glutathione peroxidase [Lutimonas saemankumensis]|uniref:glutathione peroxidase n=1 Tax=Lutimonas saemankumensis TaxID=483016 RepID=UPI001CD76A8F|nr:glutathione peroxidase [Lutimonas saemankumensis]MCA0931533.1 glutathione peroxidase [Lutimonas saemankumensis]
MKKSILVLSLILVVLGACKKETKEDQKAEVMKEETANQDTENIYQFQVEDLYGEAFDFSNLKGKKIMVVNTASECGLTPQYAELQKLYDTYKDQNFVIVGFPANNFGGQEPGTNMEIASFCKENYGVTFPMMSKISVKGADMHEVYHFLTEKSKNGLQDSEVSWNFQKYLLNEKGELAMVLEPRTLPTDSKVIDWIETK